jgi:membrane protein DedA with SNARE-associated domain
MINFQSPWVRRFGLVLSVILVLSSLLFGLRTYGSFLLLRSAYHVGLPQSSSIRAWMTLRYVATTYGVPEALLITRLDLPLNISLETTLKSLAERQHVSPFRYVQRVQESIADIAAHAPPSGADTSSNWWRWLEDEVLSLLLKYGYPALAVTLLISAIGPPIPAGLSAVLAGVLSAAGRMNLLAAFSIAVAACAIGDVTAYGLGRIASVHFLDRRGRWIGMTAERQARAQVLFQRWGAAVILGTRTLVSSLSSPVSLVAGVNHYGFSTFVALVLLGRMIWTAAYVGFGYGLGSSPEFATSFLANLTGLFLSLVMLAGALLLASYAFAGVRQCSISASSASGRSTTTLPRPR